MSDYNSDLDPTKNPTERQYRLKVKIHVVKRSAFGGIRNVISRTRQEFEQVVLVPEPSDQKVMFYNAWLPEDQPEYNENGDIIKNHPPEIVIENGDPIYGYCRCFVMRQNEIWPNSPFILVASVGVEEVLKKYKNQVIDITVLSASEDSAGDSARDAEFETEIYEG